MEDGSPIFVAVLGIFLAAFGIWLTVRFVNRGKKPSAKICAFIVLVIAGPILSVWIPFYREQLVVQEIESWGGHVETATRGPDWLRYLVGENRMRRLRAFDRIVGVQLFNPAITDAQIGHLSGLVSGSPMLQELYLSNTAVTDAGLVHLSRLTKLRRLALDGTDVTDAGLARLIRFTNIRYLHLSQTGVTDAGLARLTGATNLEFLDLHGTDVTDKGIRELQIALPACKILP